MGVRVVLAKSIERIHQSNLINFGILPLTFKDNFDYREIDKGDKLVIKNILNVINNSEIVMINKTKGKQIQVCNNLTERQVDIILKGGLSNYIKELKN
jgi:aconitate hydratase